MRARQMSSSSADRCWCRFGCRFRGGRLAASLQLRLPVLEIRRVERQVDGLVAFVVEAEADGLGVPDGLEARARQLDEELVLRLELAGICLAGRRALLDGRDHLPGVAVGVEDGLRQELRRVVAAVPERECRALERAALRVRALEVDAAVGGEALRRAVVMVVEKRVAEDAGEHEEEAAGGEGFSGQWLHGMPPFLVSFR